MRPEEEHLLLDIDAQNAADDISRANLEEDLNSGRISGEEADQKNGWFAYGWEDAKIGPLDTWPQ